MLKLGFRLGNDEVFPTAVRLVLSDSAGKVRNLQFITPRIAGAVGDYLVPVAPGFVHTRRLRLADFWCPATNQLPIALPPGEYRVEAILDSTNPQQSNVMKVWKGTISSAPITFRITKEAVAANGARPRFRLYHGSRVDLVAFSPDGATLASGSDSGGDGAKLTDVATGKVLATGSIQTLCMAFFPKVDMLALGCSDGTVVLTDKKLATWKSFPVSRWGIFAVAVSPNGATVACDASNGTVDCWDVMEGRRIQTLGAKGARMSGLAFSPDNKLLITVDRNGLGKAWDLASEKVLGTFQGVYSDAVAIRFCPDGKTAAVAFYGAGPLRFWDPRGGKPPVLVSLPEAIKPEANKPNFDSTAPSSGPLISPSGHTDLRPYRRTASWRPPCLAKVGWRSGTFPAAACSKCFPPHTERVFSAASTAWPSRPTAGSWPRATRRASWRSGRSTPPRAMRKRAEPRKKRPRRLPRSAAGERQLLRQRARNSGPKSLLKRMRERRTWRPKPASFWPRLMPLPGGRKRVPNLSVTARIWPRSRKLWPAGSLKKRN